MWRLANNMAGLFKRHPFGTNSAIYGTLYVAAEFSQQFLTKFVLAEASTHDKAIDYPTLGRYAVMGTAVYAPTLYTWYKWLDRTFPGTARTIIVKKLLMDQLMLTPFLLTVFYTGMSLMEGAVDPFHELREKFLPTFERSCMFWIPAQFVNFVFFAPRYRVIYMGVCGFLWVNILCWIKRQCVFVKSAAPLATVSNVDNGNSSDNSVNSDKATLQPAAVYK